MTNYYLRGIDRLRGDTSESRLECQLFLYTMPAAAYLFNVLVHINPKPYSAAEVLLNYVSTLVIYVAYLLWVRRPLVKLWNTKVRHIQR